MKSLWKSLLWLDFPWCNIFEKQSERKCSIFDPLWPDSSIQEGESEKFVFLENKSVFEEKKYTAFLFLLGSTYVQKLRQFEFLTPAIKISFLFHFLHGCPLKKLSFLFPPGQFCVKNNFSWNSVNRKTLPRKELN